LAVEGAEPDEVDLDELDGVGDVDEAALALAVLGGGKICA